MDADCGFVLTIFPPFSFKNKTKQKKSCCSSCFTEPSRHFCLPQILPIRSRPHTQSSPPTGIPPRLPLFRMSLPPLELLGHLQIQVIGAALHCILSCLLRRQQTSSLYLKEFIIMPILLTRTAKNLGLESSGNSPKDPQLVVGGWNVNQEPRLRNLPASPGVSPLAPRPSCVLEQGVWEFKVAWLHMLGTDRPPGPQQCWYKQERKWGPGVPDLVTWVGLLLGIPWSLWGASLAALQGTSLGSFSRTEMAISCFHLYLWFKMLFSGPWRDLGGSEQGMCVGRSWAFLKQESN